MGLPILGMVVVFAGVLAVPPTDLRLQIMVVLGGVLILEAGVWGLTNHFLPNERQYVAKVPGRVRLDELSRDLRDQPVTRSARRARARHLFEEVGRLTAEILELPSSILRNLGVNS